MGSLANLTRLDLTDNQIGDEGMKAFSTSITSGALGKLTYLNLGSNQIGDEGIKAFSAAIARGSLGNLETLMIDNPSEQLKAHCSSKKICLN